MRCSMMIVTIAKAAVILHIGSKFCASRGGWGKLCHFFPAGGAGAPDLYIIIEYIYSVHCTTDIYIVILLRTI